jgi:hypothetical protein
VTGLPAGLVAVAAVLLLAGAAGTLAAVALFARSAADPLERLAWGFAVGLVLLSSDVPLSLALGARRGAIALFVLTALAIAAAAFLRLPALRLPAPARERRIGGFELVRLLFLLPLSLGILLYLLRALTEPMWATDFLAIWGWKGKTIFGEGFLPAWTWRSPEFSFTHPEYPLGLPFLYAGISLVLGRWDDHAMALVFPALQVATLLLLAGWLRRRGAPPPIPLAAAATLSVFEPLYAAFTTGMAEVPLSFFVLLLGTALVDALEEQAGAWRRLALAAAGAAALKNEGVFVAAAAGVLAVAAGERPGRAQWRAAAAALLPAVAVSAAHRLGRGSLPLRDFRFGLLLEPGFPTRLGLGLRTILAEALLPAAAGLIAFGVLLLAGRRSTAGDRLLTLAAIPLAAYAILPAFCVFGPDWLARTAFARTAAALAPLAAAGAALRLAPLFEEMRDPGHGIQDVRDEKRKSES